MSATFTTTQSVISGHWDPHRYYIDAAVLATLGIAGKYSGLLAKRLFPGETAMGRFAQFAATHTGAIASADLVLTGAMTLEQAARGQDVSLEGFIKGLKHNLLLVGILHGTLQAAIRLQPALRRIGK